MLVLNKNEMKSLDNSAINDYGIPSIILMEYAAKSVHDYISNKFDKKSQITIVVGVGNNGADGLCLARQLKHSLYEPIVFCIGNYEKSTEEFKIHYKSLKSLGIKIYEYGEYSQNKFISEFKNKILNNDLIIDGIYGISLNREIVGIYKEIIDIINNSNTNVLSLDIPSGIDSDTGKSLGIAIKANTTICFAYPKIGLYMNEGREHSGEILISDIGIPRIANKNLKNASRLLNEDCFKNLSIKKDDSHKGNFGKILIIAGSENMAGAASLSAKAAYRAGTGIVYILTHKENKTAILSYLPEAIVYTYDNNSSKKDLENQIINLSQKVDSILIGCGLSESKIAQNLLDFTIKLDLPLVIDADAINLISKNKNIFKMLSKRKKSTILSPHLGEMSRLISKPINEIKNNLINEAKKFVKKNNINLCLKSDRTVVSFVNGNTYLNINGNSGMATAGSGDVLAGVITSHLAMYNSTEYEQAVCKAVFLHSKAGDNAKEKRNQYSIIASDIIDFL